MDLRIHHCVELREDRALYEAYGPAVTDCYGREDGTLWAGNGEYTSRVRFCPFCGCEEQPGDRDGDG
jgi:hypothetical protein